MKWVHSRVPFDPRARTRQGASTHSPLAPAFRTSQAWHIENRSERRTPRSLGSSPRTSTSQRAIRNIEGPARGRLEWPTAPSDTVAPLIRQSSSQPCISKTKPRRCADLPEALPRRARPHRANGRSPAICARPQRSDVELRPAPCGGWEAPPLPPAIGCGAASAEPPVTWQRATRKLLPVVGLRA